MALLLGATLAWVAVATLPDGRLHVTFLDVGQGDAILVQTPAGNRILIDGGPSPELLLDALGRRLPFWDRRIDLVLLSHPHDDHLRGLLSVIERYQVRQVLVGSIPTPPSSLSAQGGTAVAQHWQELLKEHGIPILPVEQSLEIDLGDGVTAQVLPASADGNGGEVWLVARLISQSATFLLTGDLEAAALSRLGQNGWQLSSTVLKVPHHGSSAALEEELLDAIRPQLAIVSVGSDNRFGHPAASTLALLAEHSIRTLRTDQVGDIDVIVDTQGWRVSTRKR